MPGWGLRSVLVYPTARFVPTRLSGIPTLLTGVLRPDVLVTRVAERGGQLHFGTEVSWQRGLVDVGVPVLAILDDAAPCADAGPALDPAIVHVSGRSSEGPAGMPQKDPEPVHDALADESARQSLLAAIAERAVIHAQHGEFHAIPLGAFEELRGPLDVILPAAPGRVDQSNTSVRYGERLILKVYRRLERGSPECR